MEMDTCVIVIPVYSSKLNPFEEASFRQSLKVFGKKRDISILTYKELDISIYDSISKSLGVDIGYSFFDKSFFVSTESYTKLCLSRALYQYYSQYTYMLICQLDVWIFRDELANWMLKGIDYVGAPWYWCDKDGVWDPELLTVVGNGGLSLRRTQRFIDILGPWFNIMNQTILKTLYKCKGFKRCIKSYVRHILILYYPEYWKIKDQYQEDLIFCVWLKNTEMELCTPSVEDALKFSFEIMPSKSYERIGGKLPMGCHAFQKNEWDEFWSRYIAI